MSALTRPGVVLAGIGDEHRSDDGVGIAVARAAAVALGLARFAGPLTEPLDLLGIWDGADLAVVVDATRSGASPGTVVVVELDPHPRTRDAGTIGAGGSGAAGPASTHGIGLLDVLRLARILERAPRRVVVVGVEGATFAAGSTLSAPVALAVPRASKAVLECIAGLR